MNILKTSRSRMRQRILEDARNLDPVRFRLKWGALSWGMPMRYAHQARTPLPILTAALGAAVASVPWFLAVYLFDLREDTVLWNVILPSVLIICAAIAILGGYRLGRTEARRGSERPADWEEYRGLR